MAETKLDLDSAISDSLAHNPDDMLTRWIVVAEFITGSGTKYLARDWESSMASWDLGVFAEQITADWEE